MATLRPVKWKFGPHAQACIECGRDFVRGDRVYHDVAVTIHADCLSDYRASLWREGLLPAAPEGRRDG